MKKLLLLSLLATSYFSAQSQCIELFISEYVEGWSNNKAIELYNPTNTAKNLSNYQLERGNNGTFPQANQKLVLSGTIEPYSTFVIVLEKLNPDGEGQEAPVWEELQDKADLFACPVYETNNVMYFNGNDALVLRNISSGGSGYVIDRIGRLGENPASDTETAEGWNNVGPEFTFVGNGSVSWTKDHSLIRKPSIQIGETPPTAIFNVSLQWDSIPPVYRDENDILKGNWNSLGSHSCECDPDFVSGTSKLGNFDFAMYPNPANRSESVTLSSKKSIDRYEVLDITGKVIDSKITSNQNKIKITLTKYNSGLYILKAYSGSTFSTQKMIVH